MVADADQHIGVAGEGVVTQRVAHHKAGDGPMEVLLQFDVDHARHGVGAVDGGGAIFFVFDLVDRSQRDAVEIEVRTPGIVEGVRCGPVAIDQHQKAVAAEPARIDRGQTAVGFLHLQY